MPYSLMYHHINAYIQAHHLIKPYQTIIVALSGGPDSVFLLHYLLHIRAEYNLTLIAAHLDHEWRSSSADDAQFCIDLCASLNIPLVVKKRSELPGLPQDQRPTEAMGRTARRILFTQVAQTYSADTVALAHHADDQQETFFIRLMRGTTLSGLCSMRPRSGMYIRPLLTISKTDIVSFLHEHAYAYVIDPTNASDTYLRNRLRNTLMPQLHQIDHRWHGNFAKSLTHLQATEDFLERLTQTTFEQLATTPDQQTYTLDLAAIRALDKIMQYRIMVHWLTLERIPFPVSQHFLDEMLRFIMHSHGGTHTLTPQLLLVKHKKTGAYYKKHEINSHIYNPYRAHN